MEERAVFKSTEKNAAYIKAATGGCFDIANREFCAGGGLSCALFYVDGLVAKDIIHDNIIRPLIEARYRSVFPKVSDIRGAVESVLSAGDVREEASLKTCVEKLLCGDTVLFMEGSAAALIIQTRGWKSKGIGEPKTQTSVRGPGEAFCETLLFNTAMLRRKIKSEKLRFEMLRIGSETLTDVCVAYVEGKADGELIKKVRKRLSKIKAEYILESGHIEQLIEDGKHSLFPTVGNNEKPDIVAAKLLKGRVAVIVDGTPFVLTVPMLFAESFHAAEDYYCRPYYANMLRLLRVAAYITALLLPAIYIALVNFHQEMIPQKLLYTIMKAKDGIPFPSVVEMLLMLALYEILREAVLRLPTPVGSTVGIVGGLIIGEAAVSAGIVGGPVVVVAAVTFICAAVVNPTLDSTSVLRVLLLIAAALLGLFGMLLGIFMLFVHLCSLESFGVPYMSPFAPYSRRGISDAVIRAPIKDIIGKRSAK